MKLHFAVVWTLLLCACSVMTPSGGHPVDQGTFDSLVLGQVSRDQVLRAVGFDPYRTRYTDTGRVDIYGVSQYSGKNYIPGYALVGNRENCTVWWFEYDSKGVLTRKWINHDCSAGR